MSICILNRHFNSLYTSIMQSLLLFSIESIVIFAQYLQYLWKHNATEYARIASHVFL